MANRFNIGNGITFFSENTKFLKFNTFTICLLIEKNRRNLLFANVLTSFFNSKPKTFSTESKYRNYVKNIYNANVEVSCNVIDDKIEMEISISVLADKYALCENENLCSKALKLLCDMVLCTDIEATWLYKAVTDEIIADTVDDDSVINDSISRAFCEIFPNTIASSTHASTIHDIKLLSHNELIKFYNIVLEKAEICIFGIGNYNEKSVCSYFKLRFGKIKRNTVKIINSFNRLSVKSVKNVVKTYNKASHSSTVLFYDLGFNELTSKNIALSNLYASFLSNELYFNIRDNTGLVYSFGVFAYPNFNVLAVLVNVTKENLETVIAGIKTTIRNFFLMPGVDIQFQNEKSRLLNRLNLLNNSDDLEPHLSLTYFGNVSYTDIASVSFKEFLEFCMKISKDDRFIGSYFEIGGEK